MTLEKSLKLFYASGWCQLESSQQQLITKTKIWPRLTFKERKCISSSNQKSSLVVLWWDMSVAVSDFISVKLKGNETSVQSEGSSFPSKPLIWIGSLVPMTRQCCGLNSLGLSSWINHWQGMELPFHQLGLHLELSIASVSREIFGMCWGQVNTWAESGYG